MKANPLDHVRRQIDAIDTELVALLNRRLKLVEEVGRLKRASGGEIYAPAREQALLARLSQKNKGPLPDESLRAIYREIMSAAISLEKDIVIAAVGPKGGACHKAAVQKFGRSLSYALAPTIGKVFEAVVQKRADYGVVPIETVDDGTVTHTLDIFVDQPLRICAQIVTGRRSPRAARPGALEQASRFFIVGRTSPPSTGRDRTSLLFSLPDRPGMLCKALACFSSRGVNLLKIESRPSWRMGFKYHFFVDVSGHLEDAPVAGALAALGKIASAMKVLGSYPEV